MQIAVLALQGAFLEHEQILSNLGVSCVEIRQIKDLNKAPFIREVYGAALPLATVRGKVVAARQGKQLVTAFHPELNSSMSIHEYFCNMIQKS